MQNRNNTIEERLQIINDYIQRTMDALNATRQVVQGLSTSTNFTQNVVPQNVSGLTHSSFVPQFVQTPYGLVAINVQIPQAPQYPQVQFGYGLQHASFVPQLPGWPMNVAQLGIPQVGINQLGLNQLGLNQLGIPQVGYNYGLNHTAFVPQVSPWGVPMLQQWPINQAVGFNPQFGMNQLGLNQLGVNPQHIVQQGVPTQTF